MLGIVVVDRIPGGTQIQQHRRAEILQKDIFWRNIAVQHVGVVQYPQRAQHRPQQLAQPRLSRWSAHVGARLLERHAVVHRHHHVGGVFFFPEPEYFDQRRMVELRQHARFFHKRFQPRLKCWAVGGRARGQIPVLHPGGKRRRHVLFDGHGSVQRVVKRFVDHAETAHPEQRKNFEFRQARAHRQRVNVSHVASIYGANTVVHSGKRSVLRLKNAV